MEINFRTFGCESYAFFLFRQTPLKYSFAIPYSFDSPIATGSCRRRNSKADSQMTLHSTKHLNWCTGGWVSSSSHAYPSKRAIGTSSGSAFVREASRGLRIEAFKKGFAFHVVGSPSNSRPVFAGSRQSESHSIPRAWRTFDRADRIRAVSSARSTYCVDRTRSTYTGRLKYPRV